MKLAGLLMFINDVHSLGLKATEGMYLTDSWYWNHDARDARLGAQVLRQDEAHAVLGAGRRLFGVQTYLKAVKATGTDDADKVIDHMHKTKVNDMYAKGGYIRPDGRMVHDMYLMQVKTPAESKEPLGLLQRRRHDQGRRRLHDEGRVECALWK